MSEILGARVRVHGVCVGQLDRISDDEQEYVFTFDEAWLRDPARPTLGQQFEDRRPRRIQSSGFPAWFAHLLPQGPWGRAISRSLGLDEDGGELELLLAIGEDLPGAVTLEPAASHVLGAPARPPEPATCATGMAFSLAGAQWKISVRQGERGLVIPVRGQAGDWIAKFHDRRFPGLPRVELATTRWAAAAGLCVPEVRPGRVGEFEALPEGVPRGDGTVFLTRRFDRSADARVHMEDFGQILGYPPGGGVSGQYTGSYEQMGRTLAALAPQDLGEWIDRLVFVVLSGNGDAHLKNWSVLYPDRRTPRLAPAYDLVSTVVYSAREDLALSLGGSRSFSAVDIRAFEALAPMVGWDLLALQRRVHEARDRVFTAWREDRSAFGYTLRETERLERHMRACPLSR